MTRAKVKKRHRFLGALGHAFPAGTMAVGRLDRATEGLLLLTTDGRLSYHVTTAGRVEKEYWAELDGVETEAVFFRHEGYFGAIGAFLSTVEGATGPW